MQAKNQPAAQQRRRYIRLNSVFPVSFRLLDSSGKCFLSDWMQGFTNNISRGGICLSVNNFSSGLAKSLEERSAKLHLAMTIPLNAKAVQADAVVSWIRETGKGEFSIGLAYEYINPKDNSRIMRYTLGKKALFPLVVWVSIILAAAFGVGRYNNSKLTEKNQALVQRLFKINQAVSFAHAKIVKLNKEQEGLLIQSKGLGVRIQEVEKERSAIDAQSKLAKAEELKSKEEAARTKEEAVPS